MAHWREMHRVCYAPMCPTCETKTAIGQRIIFAVLAAIREGDS
jgi:hypothetical protein